MVLWVTLGLDGFWARKLPPSRKGTGWLAIVKAVVLHRFTAPGGELEAHAFTSFMAPCPFQTLRAIAREHAPGLTPRQIVEKFNTTKMVDVVMPTTDHRIVTLPRYMEPKNDVAILLGRLGLL